ncbi:uncharacterized protein RJT21DRAFT_20075 [Scheffersomyces amazonensis]|uniref:uncharacterized protein n=1 Tax=Scheffersomyces amazonensis TaxID=1078765 RepID=UPI00315DEF65
MHISRKHQRSSEESASEYGEEDEDLLTSFHGNKRIKLDNLFDDLSLKDNNNNHKPTDDAEIPELVEDDTFISENKYIVSNKIQSFQFLKELEEDDNISSLNQYFSNKLYENYKQYINSHLKVIKWYNFKFLIVYVFQKWCVKLFNKFIKKFNQQNNSKIPKFSSYEKIIRLIREGKLTIDDYFTILLNENNLDMIELKKRQARRRQRIEIANSVEDNLDIKDIKYTYWDNIKFDPDTDMEKTYLSDEQINNNFNNTRMFTRDSDMTMTMDTDSELDKEMNIDMDMDLDAID